LAEQQEGHLACKKLSQSQTATMVLTYIHKGQNDAPPTIPECRIDGSQYGWNRRNAKVGKSGAGMKSQ